MKDRSGSAALGIDIGGTKIACGAVVYEDGAAKVVQRAEAPTETRLGGEHMMQTIIGVARTVLDRLDARARSSVRGIGVATFGCPDPATGSIASSNGVAAGWTGMPVAKRLHDSFGLPAVLMGDVQAHALGEARWGAARGTDSSLTVAPGTGLGGGIVIGGRVVKGAHGIAGHIGHSLHPLAADRRCTCGALGHVEAVTSGPGIGGLYQGKAPTDPAFDPAIDGAWVSRRAAEGDPRATAALKQAGRALGESIGSWVNILDPEVVVLSGSVCKAGPVWRAAVVEGFAAQALAPVAQTPVLDGVLGGDAPLFGAAEDALDSLEG